MSPGLSNAEISTKPSEQELQKKKQLQSFGFLVFIQSSSFNSVETLFTNSSTLYGSDGSIASLPFITSSCGLWSSRPLPPPSWLGRGELWPGRNWALHHIPWPRGEAEMNTLHGTHSTLQSVQVVDSLLKAAVWRI